MTPKILVSFNFVACENFFVFSTNLHKKFAAKASKSAVVNTITLPSRAHLLLLVFFSQISFLLRATKAATSLSIRILNYDYLLNIFAFILVEFECACDFASTHDPLISKPLFINKNHVTTKTKRKKKTLKLTQKLVCHKLAKLVENAA